MKASDSIIFEVAGAPQGKGRARAYRAADTIRHYTPEATRSYEGMVRLYASLAMRGRAPTEAPVSLDVVAVFDVPRSFSKADREFALAHMIRPAKKPDIDNIIKAISDGMNTVVFKDDCQIVEQYARKVYGLVPRVIVTVKSL